MGLEQLDFKGRNKVEVTLARFKEFEPPDGYFLAFSGGKDSVVLYDLAVRSGVKFEAHYNRTGIDPPEVMRFIKTEYPRVIWERPPENMWQLVQKKGLPRRNSRFCCEDLKEYSGTGRLVLTGIRWQESAARHKRAMREECPWHPGKQFLHPIIDWSKNEVWEYIRRFKILYCALYDEGARRKGYGEGEYKRLGCVLCPMTSHKQALRDMVRWPKIAEAWHRATIRYWERGTKGGKKFKTAEDFWQFWLSRKKQGVADACPMFS